MARTFQMKFTAPKVKAGPKTPAPMKKVDADRPARSMKPQAPGLRTPFGKK